MIKKLQTRNGFSLIELLVTIAVLVLLVVGIGTSMNAASRVYNDSTFESESATLAGIIDTSLEDILRYAEIEIDEGAEGRVAALTNSDFSITNKYYLATKVKLIVDENGYLAFNKEGASHYLVTPGAYHNMKITEFQILYDATYGVFDISYTIVSTADAGKTRSESFSVRSANASTAYLLEASEEETIKYYTVFLHYIESEESIVVYRTLDSVPSGTPIRPDDPQLQTALADIARDYGITSTTKGKWYREVGGSEFLQEQLFDNLHLYARFAPDEITVTFDSQGGTRCDQKTCVYGSAYGNLPTPSRTGYTFLGWYTAASGGTQVTSTTKVTASANQTLYAHWQANTYTVVFNGNGALSGSMISQTFTYDEAQKLEENTFSWAATVSFNIGSDASKNGVKTPDDLKINRDFRGWSTSPNTHVAQYKDKASIRNLAESGTVTLYAVWDDSTPDYIILPTLKTYDSGFFIFSKTYACVGWYTGEAFADADLAGRPAAEYKPKKSETTLYAKWVEDDFSTITCYYYYNNEEKDKKSFTVEDKKDFTLPEYNNFTNGYYHVEQWYKEKSFETAASWSQNVSSSKEFYAKLTPNTVTYKDGGAVIAKENFTSNYTLRAKPTSNFVFDGWYDAAGSKIGGAGDAFPYVLKESNVDLYAHWLKYTIQFVVKESKATISGTVKFTGKVPTVDVPTATRPGYRFNGWYDSSGTKVIFPYAATTGDVTLHAEWVKAYTVKFDLNGISGAISPLTTETAPAVSLPLTSRTGYSFAGWYTDRTNGTRAGGSGDSYTPSGDITLYAHWTANNYTVHFNGNGNTGGSMSDQTFVYDKEQPLTKNGFTRSGYTFAGWAISATGKVVYTDGQSVKNLITTKDGAFNLYAHWTANTNTPYIVKHYKQQLDGSYASTPDATDKLTGTTDTSVTPAVKSYTGFTAPAKTTVTIAGNGSTVVVYQYTRDSYALTWNVNGGTVTESHTPSGSVKFGAELIPPTVTKTGYTFAGWNPAPPKTMPASASIYTAQWTAIKYTIAFNGNGSTSGSTASMTNREYDQSYALTANGFTRTGYTFDGWATSATGGAIYSNGQSVSNLSDTNGATVTLYAHWKPNTNTAYTVKHYKQDLNGTTYTLAETENKTGTTASQVTPAVKSYAGFTAPSAQTVTIKPDGSTVVEYKYTRKSYTLAWELDGGTASGGTAGGNVKYGANITAPTVKKTGYTFKNWSPSVPGTMPANDATYEAQWAANTDTPYTVKHLLENLDGSYSEVTADSQKLTGTTDTQTNAAAKSYTGFTAQTVTQKNINGDGSTVVEIRYTRNSYKLTWALEGGTATGGTAGGNVKYGANITAPTVKKTGYTFKNWSPAVPGTMPASDATYEAQWDENSYTISFNANGGSVSPASKTLKYTESYTLPTLTRTGYTFTGWSDGTTTRTAGTSVSKLAAVNNATVMMTAQWKINQYTITFNTDGGTAVNAITQDYATKITKPGDPTKIGYTFAGWDKDIPATMPAENMTVKAQWTANSYTVKFDGNGSTGGSMDNQSRSYNDNVALAANAFSRTGYTFTGWNTAANGSGTKYSDKQVANLSSTAGANITLYAQWKINQYTITFNTDGGSTISAITQDYGTTVKAPADPTKTGYTFDGWDKAIPKTMPNNNVTITANWKIKTYTVVLKSTGEGKNATTVTFTYRNFGDTTETTKSLEVGNGKTGSLTLYITHDGQIKYSYKDKYPTSDDNKPHYNDSDSVWKQNTYQTVTSDSTTSFVTAGACISSGTLITLADGTQVPVEQLTGTEELLVWSLETGRYDKAKIVFVDSEGRTEYEIIHLFFSDGSDVEVISEHGFFDIDLGKYVYLDAENAADNIGHRYIKQGNLCANDWETVVLTDVKIEHKATKAYSPVTAGHLCYYVNGVLSMPGGIDGLFNIFDVDTEVMCYDSIAKANDLAEFGTYSYDDFADLIPEEMFEAFNGRYLKVAMAKGIITWDDIAYLAKRYTPLAMGE